MNYVLPRSIRENLIRKSVYDFETQYLLISAIEKRIATEIVETIPLWESLFSIGFKNGKNDWEFSQWRDIYLENGWNEVKGLSKLKNGLENHSNKRAEFIKNIEGVSYKRSFADDLEKFWVWNLWIKDRDAFKKRYSLVKQATFNLNCLKLYSSIYLHEAFLIMLGVSPDDIDRKEFCNWMVGSSILPFKKRDMPDKLKTKFEDFKEWNILRRHFRKGITSNKVSHKKANENFEMIEIDTNEFIKWALDNRIIEKAPG